MFPTSDDFFPSQSQTPLLDTLQVCANKPDAAFYSPGHKRGQGIAPPLANLLGELVFQADLPELPELDNLFAPEGVIGEAQQLAAAAFGAQKTWFLVNGSTCGVMAAMLATCHAGEKIILPRNIHQSAIAGLILSGAIPIYIYPEYDPNFDLAYSITPAAVEAALKQHPDAQAVMMLYPTYQGICGDVEAIAHLAHQHHLPLLVDEAHGAHFAFHPDLPPSALSAGADLTVQSSHKVLGAMTQASMLHLQGNHIDAQSISQALQLLQSSSPSYLLLASLDGARQQMALQGKPLMTKTLQLADDASTKIKQIPGLSVLESTSNQPIPGFITLDCTRVTVNVSQLNLSGFEADEILREQFGVTAELPMHQHLTFIVTLGNTAADIEKLVQSLTALAKQHQTTISPQQPECYQPRTLPPSQLSPRNAFFSPTQSLLFEQAIGYISAELVCPYPPGIPVLMPGETITSASLDYLQQVLAFGGKIIGCSDATLTTLKVVG